jgi:hypothetical protein
MLIVVEISTSLSLLEGLSDRVSIVPDDILIIEESMLMNSSVAEGKVIISDVIIGLWAGREELVGTLIAIVGLGNKSNGSST